MRSLLGQHQRGIDASTLFRCRGAPTARLALVMAEARDSHLSCFEPARAYTVDTLSIMSMFFSQNFLIPAWFITIGVVALSTPPPTMGVAAFLLVGVVIVPAAIFALGLRWSSAAAAPSLAQPTWQDARRTRVSAIAEGDARDLARMDSDKG